MGYPNSTNNKHTSDDSNRSAQQSPVQQPMIVNSGKIDTINLQLPESYVRRLLSAERDQPLFGAGGSASPFGAGSSTSLFGAGSSASHFGAGSSASLFGDPAKFGSFRFASDRATAATPAGSESTPSEDGYELVSIKKVDDEHVIATCTREYQVALHCPCEKKCNKLVAVGAFAKHATDAAVKCPHCAADPDNFKAFWTKATFTAHLKTAACTAKRAPLV